MSVCFLLILLIRDAHSYDQFHHDVQLIYRINTEALRKDGNKEPYASSPYPVTEMLANNYDGIEAWTVLNSEVRTELIIDNQRIPATVQFTEKSFFDVFNYSLETGDPAKALEDPNSIILSEELANKLFPKGDALDKTIEMRNKELFKVTGILEKPNGKTHLAFDALASISSVPLLEKKKLVSPTLTDWQNYYSNYSYIKLRPATSPESVEHALASISQLNYKDKVLEPRDAGYRFYLQPLNDITPGPLLSNSSGKGIPAIVLWALGLLAAIIMLSSVFNYTSLSIARASTRMKEIAMCKVVGARRSSIFSQILLESVMMALISSVVAFLLLQILIPGISAISFINSLDIDFSAKPEALLLFIVFAIAVGVMGGILPGLALSSIKPLALFANLQNTKLFKRLGLRNTLLCIQFLLSLIFVNLIYISRQQMNYATEINFGFQNAKVFNIYLQGQSYQKALESFGQIAEVENISAISHLMGTYSDFTDDVRTTVEKEPISVRGYFIDDQYINNMNLQMLSGKSFEPDYHQAHEKFLIVNEVFLKKFDLGNPVEAIGKTIFIGDSLSLSISGVVKDFLFKPAEYSLEALILRYNPPSLQILNLRLHPGNDDSAIAKMQSIWKTLDADHAFEGRFYDDDVERAFAGNNDALFFISLITFLGIVITCLGLLGITIFTVQSKAREITIRKIFGAGTFNVIRLLSKSYFHILFISISVATPIIFLLARQLLQLYNNHIPLSPVLLIPGFLIVFIITLLTISTQTIKAAFSKPVNSLRTD
jgi:putative ABC transport system permease protein